MKNILVPTDFSKESLNAVDVAVTMASLLGAEVLVKHVLDVPVYYHKSSNSYEVDRTEMKKRTEAAKEEMRKLKETFNYEKAKFSIITRSSGDFSETIVEKETDLLILGTKGTSGWHELLIGSNAEKVVRMAESPVITVKEKQENFKVEKIVIPVDLDINLSKTIPLIKKYVSWFDAQAHFVYINTPSNFNASKDTWDKLEKFKSDAGFDGHVIAECNAFNEDEGIIDYARYVKADLIMMATHGREGLSRLFKGSVTEDVVNHSDIPVFAFKFEK